MPENERGNVFTYETVIDAPIQVVWEFFSEPINLAKLSKFPKLEVDSATKMVEGGSMTLKIRVCGFPFRWGVLFEKVEEPICFIDHATTLPFLFTDWRHEHQFIRDGDRTKMVDTVIYQSVLSKTIVNVFLERMFRQREDVLRQLYGQ
ncbi:SRPBCC family protein [Halalkalibacter hemicellulosilyticus]|uniref:Cell division inhibitor n=1 Tax=Halalkalibacter hemicellulosilyticusJCM 9152 TaxID=1236971 RepID=W4QFA8_9BACI|nr:hypothetical protein [Halalkalibacter hemicellulosilyticus]GAE30785.1 hypothetical protein JCM9152_2202 [Halalkalibacter hemicellulosilyticusJCM 9152]